VRVILDTNVLASGLFFTGIPLKILNAIKQRRCTLVISSEIADEYKRTANKLASRFPDIKADAQLELIIMSSEICQPKEPPAPVCQDPDDDMFIACAITSDVKVIVSGDKHLLDVSGYNGIEVLSPRRFAEKYLKKN